MVPGSPRQIAVLFALAIATVVASCSSNGPTSGRLPTVEGVAATEVAPATPSASASRIEITVPGITLEEARTILGITRSAGRPSCSVDPGACALAARVYDAVARDDYASIVSLAQPVTITCRGDAPVSERCAAEGKLEVSGFTRVLAGKSFTFVPTDTFLADTESDLRLLTGRPGVVSVGCGSLARGTGGTGSCANRMTLALGDLDKRNDSLVVLLFFEAGAADWILRGSGTWYANDQAINGGPLGGIWLAGGSEQEIWFTPLR